MMKRRVILFLTLSALCLGGYVALSKVMATKGLGFVAEASKSITQGSLQVMNPEGQAVNQCPLKRTDVKAEISGFLARVVVTQEFENPFNDKIEAVYTFPLPQNAAVDNMTMRVGDRTVRGKIKRREEAQAIYEMARSAGHVASLLDQERPNIFTQSVANIMPGEQVKITISYVETLKYEDGSYEFVFPMVVGPRYIPGAPTGKQGGGWSPDTTRVPDASRITPQVAPKGTRAGHDISIEVALDAGVPVDGLKSVLHDVAVDRPTDHSAFVSLRNKAEIPNKDFILKYDVAGRKVEDAILAHRSDKGSFFTMILQPPDRVTAQDVTPKELVFVLDTSGSMSGFPIEKAKETMKLALDGLYPQDTFNLITFSGDTHILFPEPVAATRENLRRAQEFLASRSGGGGTEMMTAIRAALDPSDSQNHVRIVCFMTDGYVGNDMEIIAEVQKHPNARVFSFGIGGSVNRFLLDKMAEHGRGEVEYVSLQDDGSAAARRFHERVRNPLLTDISIDWGGLSVADVYPQRIPDLFSARPVILTGRYAGGYRGAIKLKGRMAGREFVRDIAVDLPESQPRGDVLATLWARARIDDLMGQDYNGIQQGNAREDVREQITALGLEFRLMTQYTSFVAVEEMTVTDGGEPRRVEVPVDMPEGVRHEGVFGEKDEFQASFWARKSPASVASVSAGGGGGGGPMRRTKEKREEYRPRADKSGGGIGTGSGGGVGSGDGSGIGPGRGYGVGGSSRLTEPPKVIRKSGGVMQGEAVRRVQPAYPPVARAAKVSGQVVVEVTVDEAGNVTAARALSGHAMLNDAAAKAAREWKFRPTMLNGKPVKVLGTITFDFNTGTGELVKTSPLLTQEQQKAQQIESKFHPSLVAIVERLKNKSAPGVDEAKFVRDGKAEVQVWLTDKTPETIEQLKKLGFEVVLEPKSAKMVIGRIGLDKLTALAELSAVRYVAPMNQN